MDQSSSKISGGAAEEECHSSESGWTKYIGDDYDDSYETGGGGEGGDHHDHLPSNAVSNNYDDDDDNSDDSMASDASSGPSFRLQPRPQWGCGEHFKLDDDGKYSLYSKAKIATDQRKHRGGVGPKRRDAEKEKTASVSAAAAEMLAKSAKVLPAQAFPKVRRKSFGLEKKFN